jgi:putative flippase GtrA
MTARAEAIRVVRYGLVGLSNTALTFVAYTLLTAAGAAAPAASAIGFALGAVNGYLLNGRWTFAGSARGAATLARYVAVQALGAAASAAGVALARGDGVPRIPSELAVLPAVTLLTYALARTVVFAACGSSRDVARETAGCRRRQARTQGGRQAGGLSPTEDAAWR